MLNLDKREIDFIGRRKALLAVSLVVLLASVCILCFRGLDLSSEFVGGSTITYVNVSEGTTDDDVEAALRGAGYEGDAQVQAMSSNGAEGFLARISTLDVEQADQIASSAAQELGVADADIEVSTIGPNWGAGVLASMALAAGVAMVLVLAYVTIRFRDLKMGVIAVADMVFDVTVTLGILSAISIFYPFTLSPAVVGSLITVGSYGLYDTIVSFRSVEDTKGSVKGQGWMTIVNNAINKVLVRSANTTITTLLPVLMMLVLGGATLTDFALALFCGIVVGALSTIGVAMPLYAIWRSRDLGPAKLGVEFGMAVNTDTAEVLGYDKGPDDIGQRLVELREQASASA